MSSQESKFHFLPVCRQFVSKLSYLSVLLSAANRGEPRQHVIYREAGLWLRVDLDSRHQKGSNPRKNINILQPVVVPLRRTVLFVLSFRHEIRDVNEI